MPEHYWLAEDNNEVFNDGFFIHEQLSRLTLSQRSKAAEAYGNLYSGVDSRRECNERLRAFADRCVKTNRGDTKKPGFAAGVSD
jgi:hypothetical protein